MAGRTGARLQGGCLRLRVPCDFPVGDASAAPTPARRAAATGNAGAAVANADRQSPGHRDAAGSAVALASGQSAAGKEPGEAVCRHAGPACRRGAAARGDRCRAASAVLRPAGRGRRGGLHVRVADPGAAVPAHDDGTGARCGRQRAVDPGDHPGHHHARDGAPGAAGVRARNARTEGRPGCARHRCRDGSPRGDPRGQRQVLPDLAVRARGAGRQDACADQFRPPSESVLERDVGDHRPRPGLERRNLQPRQGRHAVLGADHHRAAAG